MHKAKLFFVLYAYVIIVEYTELVDFQRKLTTFVFKPEFLTYTIKNPVASFTRHDTHLAIIANFNPLCSRKQISI